MSFHAQQAAKPTFDLARCTPAALRAVGITWSRRTGKLDGHGHSVVLGKLEFSAFDALWRTHGEWITEGTCGVNFSSVCRRGGYLEHKLGRFGLRVGRSGIGLGSAKGTRYAYRLEFIVKGHSGNG